MQTSLWTLQRADEFAVGASPADPVSVDGYIPVGIADRDQFVRRREQLDSCVGELVGLRRASKYVDCLQSRKHHVEVTRNVLFGCHGDNLGGRAGTWRRKCPGVGARSPTVTHDPLDLGCHDSGVFVFPEPAHDPARRSEIAIVASVAFDVGPELRAPPFPVRLWSRGVLRARVPEATVQEHRDTLTAEHDVRAGSRHPRNRQVDAVPQPFGVEQTLNSDFERRVPPWRVPHPPPHDR